MPDQVPARHPATVQLLRWFAYDHHKADSFGYLNGRLVAIDYGS